MCSIREDADKFNHVRTVLLDPSTITAVQALVDSPSPHVIPEIVKAVEDDVAFYENKTTFVLDTLLLQRFVEERVPVIARKVRERLSDHARVEAGLRRGNQFAEYSGWRARVRCSQFARGYDSGGCDRDRRVDPPSRRARVGHTQRSFPSTHRAGVKASHDFV